VVKSTGNMLVAEVTRTFSVAAKMFRQHAGYLPWSGKPSLLTIPTLTLFSCIKESEAAGFVSWYSTARADLLQPKHYGGKASLDNLCRLGGLAYFFSHAC
jgi:hypothetical protein